MIFDLTCLVIIGCILEGICIKLGAEVFNGVPTTTFSLLIIFVAVARWNLWGLLICPLLAAATFIGGQQIQLKEFQACYTWELAVSVCIGLLTVGINILFFRKNKTGSVVNSAWLIGILALNYLLFSVAQIYSYRLLTSGSLFEIAERIFEYSYATSNPNIEGGIKLVRVNICQLVEGGMAYNLFGLAVLYIGVYVLRSQGVICNAIQRLIDDRKNAELDRIDSNFTISEVEDDDSVGENQSSKEE